MAANEPVPSYPGAHLALSTGATLDAIDANGAALPGAALPVKVLRNTAGGISLGCDPGEYTAAGVAGKLVVKRVPLHLVHRVAGVVFAGLAVLAGVAAVRG